MSSSVAPYQSYTGVAKALHWLTVLLVFVMIPAGLVMADAEAGPMKNFLFDLHRSLGVTVSILTIIRLIYRLKNPPPPLDASVSAPQRLAAHVVHFILYAGLIFLPVGGLLGAWMFGASLNYFWLFALLRRWSAMSRRRRKSSRCMASSARSSRSSSWRILLRASPITLCSRTTRCGGCRLTEVARRGADQLVGGRIKSALPRRPQIGKRERSEAKAHCRAPGWDLEPRKS